MRSWLAAARRYCSATVRFAKESKVWAWLWAGRRCAAASSRVASAKGRRREFCNEIRELAYAAREADMKVILGLGCRSR